VTTTLTDNREAALKVGFDAVKWPDGLSYDAYQAAFAPWEVKAIERDGECIGAAYTKDCELHIAIDRKWQKRWCSRGILKQLFDMPKVIARPIEREDIMYSYLTSLGFKDQGNKTLVLERA